MRNGNAKEAGTRQRPSELAGALGEDGPWLTWIWGKKTHDSRPGPGVATSKKRERAVALQSVDALVMHHPGICPGILTGLDHP